MPYAPRLDLLEMPAKVAKQQVGKPLILPRIEPEREPRHARLGLVAGSFWCAASSSHLRAMARKLFTPLM